MMKTLTVSTAIQVALLTLLMIGSGFTLQQDEGECYCLVHCVLTPNTSPVIQGECWRSVPGPNILEGYVKKCNENPDGGDGCNSSYCKSEVECYFVKTIDEGVNPKGCSQGGEEM